MPRLLKDKNHRLTAHTGWVLDTDYEIASSESTTILLASANEVDALPLHNLVAVRDFVLGVTGEETINDPPLALIGSSEAVPGQTTYDGSQMRSYRNSTAADDMFTALRKGTTKDVISRIGLPSSQVYAATDKNVRHFKIQFGSPMMDSEAGAGWYTALHKMNVTEAYELSTIAASL